MANLEFFPGTLRAGIILTALAILFILFVLLADQILPRSFVRWLSRASAGLPSPIVQLIQSIESRQQERQIFHERVRENPFERDVPAAGGETLYIATMATPQGESGVQAHFNELIQYLHEQKVPTRLISPSRAPLALRILLGLTWRTAQLFSKSAKTIVVSCMNQWILQRQLRSALPREGSWVVYAQCPWSALAAVRCRRSDSQRVALVVHFNISQSEEMAEQGLIERSGNAYRRIRRREEQALLAVDQVIYVSKFMQDCLIERIPGLSSKQSQVIPNFVREETGLQGGLRGDLITIGTLEPRKNQQFLLRLLARARDLGRVYTLTIVGTGRDEAHLRALAETLGIRDQVTFAGYVPHAATILHGFRAYVNVAKMENLGVAMIEAMAAGLPVLSGDVGGNRELVLDGVTGQFLDLENLDKSAATLMSLLEDEQRRRSEGLAGRERWKNEFSTDVVARRVYEFLRQREAPAA